ncbi:MAG: hypothetical protein MI892_15865 [Desulfobacterales bacterium]|nr:hypothetical protein [Desulfobacterales bacterium]
MQGIQWQSHVRKRPPKQRQKWDNTVSSSAQPDSSYASRFLKPDTPVMETKENSGSGSVSFSQQYLRKNVAVQSSDPGLQGPQYTQPFQPAPQQQVDPWPDSQAPQVPYQAPQASYQEPPANGYRTPPVQEYADPGQQIPPQQDVHPAGAVPAQQRMSWRFLDLGNKKQTGDLHKRLMGYSKKSGCKSFCFTSSTPKEGVSTVLVNLVDYIRQNAPDKTTIVIDAKLVAPKLHQVFGASAKPYGLVEVMSGQVLVQDVLTPVAPNIWLLGSGAQRKYKDGNLRYDGFAKLLKDCGQLADYILIDSPPVLSSSDSMTVAPAADVTFMILQAVKIHRLVVLKSIQLLHDNECEMGGVILNRVQQVIPGWVYKFL